MNAKAFKDAKIAGLILAGGQARRMGGAVKADLMVGGRTCFSWVFQALKGQCCDVGLSVGKPQTVPQHAYPCDILADEVGGRGPLSGILAGLIWAKAHHYDAILTVPVDTPFVPRTLARDLYPAFSFASYGGRKHFLVSLLSVRALDFLKPYMATITDENCRSTARVIKLLEPFSAREVDFTKVYPQDPFENINTPQALRAAQNSPFLQKHVLSEKEDA